MGDSTPPSRRAPRFLDDRGRPLNFAPRLVVAGQIWDRVPARVRLGTWMPLVLLGACFAWALLPNPRPPTWQDFLAVCLTFGVCILLDRLTRPGKRRLQSPFAAYLAAHRMCGACGHDLHGIVPEGDDRVVCPKCGAAWHRDRFVLADQDPRGSPTLSSLLDLGQAFATEALHDDRGVPMRYPWRWPPRWLFDARMPTGAADDLLTIARAKRWRFRARAIPIALLAWGAASAGLLSAIDRIERFDVILVGVVTFMIAAVIYFVAGRIYMERTMRRQPVEALGLCRSCGARLPSDAAPAFDGCVVCPSCRRAWRLAGPTAIAPAGVAPVEG